MINKFNEIKKNMFNIGKKKLDTLIKTDRYKNSDYKIQKVNDRYGIKHISGKYVDLCNGVHMWEYGSIYTKDCFGGLSKVIRVFNFCVPVIEPLNVEKTY